MRTALKCLIAALLFCCLGSYAGNGNEKSTPASAAPISAAANIYKIQILTLCCPLPEQAKFFKRLNSKVEESTFKDQYIYTVGGFSNMQKAQESLLSIRKQYPHAFIVEFKAGKRSK